MSALSVWFWSGMWLRTQGHFLHSLSLSLSPTPSFKRPNSSLPISFGWAAAFLGLKQWSALAVCPLFSTKQQEGLARPQRGLRAAAPCISFGQLKGTILIIALRAIHRARESCWDWAWNFCVLHMQDAHVADEPMMSLIKVVLGKTCSSKTGRREMMFNFQKFCSQLQNS